MSFDPSSLNTWEIVALLVVIAVSAFIRKSWDRPFRAVEGGLSKFARRPVLPLFVLAAIAIIARLSLQPLLHTPEPVVHDEFSYLLAADTFVDGRVANPAHPLWKFFESFHILQQPTYASMYPPAQGVFLAAGRLVAGDPWAGVLLSSACFIAALFWMLRGWMPPAWALVGALLAIVRLGLFSYWVNSYWGGYPAAIGGALVAGALPRIVRERRVRDGLLFGLGVLLLAASRPFEGFFFTAPFAVVLLIRMVRDKRLMGAGAAVGGVLLLSGAALAYYNWRITGSALLFPEVLENRQYGTVGNFLWDRTQPPPHYNNEVMRAFYVDIEPGNADVPHSLVQAPGVLWRKAVTGYRFFLGPLFAAPLILAFLSLFTKTPRLLMAALLTTAAAIACERWSLQAHYFAPATCLIYALVVFSLQRIWTRNRFVVRGFVLVALVMVAVRIFADPLGIDLPAGYSDVQWSATPQFEFDRAKMLERLNRMPGQFLVIVHYPPDHSPDFEWVYNEADIDHAKVVWARDLGGETDALVRYYPKRHVIRLGTETVFPDLVFR